MQCLHRALRMTLYHDTLTALCIMSLRLFSLVTGLNGDCLAPVVQLNALEVSGFQRTGTYQINQRT